MAKRSRSTVKTQPPHERWPGVSIPIDECGGRYYFDATEADRAVEFFETCLRHSDGEFAGQPFTLDDWQRDLIVRPLFGWKRTRDDLRRFRKVRIFIAKKNGKTQLAAGIALFMQFCDGEPGATIICAAADRSQAKVIFRAARNMVEDAPELRDMAAIYSHSIAYGRNVLQVVSSDVKTKHGPNLSCLVFDEFHAQPDRHLYETLSKGTAARRQPIDLIITTAGSNTESICYEEYEYAKKVQQGIIEDDTVLPVIFEASIEDDWTAPAVWAKANPSLGKTVKRDYLQAECAAATADPRKQNSFKQLHLNIWTAQETVWIPIEWWDACQRSRVGEQRYDVQVAGLDLSTREDLTALVIVRRVPLTEAITIDVAAPDSAETEAAPARRTLNVDFGIEVIPFFWLPADTLADRVKHDRVPYDVWHQQGILRVTDGNVVDYDAMLADILDEIAPAYGLLRDDRGRHAPADRDEHHGMTVCFDPWNCGQFAGALRDEGFYPIEVPQNVSRLSEPSKLFHALVKACRAWHDGHRVMRWCVSNVAAKEDRRGNIFPHKLTRTKRIDGVLATITALSQLAVASTPPPYRSIYETRGVLRFSL